MARLEGMKDVLTEKYKNSEFQCQLIVGKDILESIENYIKKEKIDIISLTTHKRNMITRLFNPSLARRMIFHTKTPLLIFHG
jgi:nucleotide-binding universal stress UspA family protein